jgi:two-component system sensor kinase FixL
MAYVDRVQIQQVLVNLVRNALEAMSGNERGRELSIRAAPVGNEMIEIAVADRGPGLPQDVAEHLFEPFITTKRKGMGLGLSICQSIVSAHGGLIRSEPNPGGGTIFAFTLEATRRSR